MRIPSLPECHLTYCTNIHPGEAWPEVFENLQQHLPSIKKSVSPDKAMGLGLRLSAVAALELAMDENLLMGFYDWLAQEDLYVFTLNGFPFSTFHGEEVKERVYQPDWASEDRLNYTKNLALLLAEILPAGLQGSISTVPVGFKPDFADESKTNLAVNALLDYVVFAIELEERTGKLISLALEPEPGCFLEDVKSTVDFFNHKIFTQNSIGYLRNSLDERFSIDLDTIRRYLGVCLDTCHAAVMFESPLEMAEALKRNYIPIHKVQLTAALKVENISEEKKEMLRPFAENIYLHQTSIKNESRKIVDFYLDLSEALDKVVLGSELRSHFHVPVFVEDLSGLKTTQQDLVELLESFEQNDWTPHLEVETYTFDVLPDALKVSSVEENISRELLWVLDKLQ